MNDTTGLATAAENRGFCRSSDDNKVDPERGKPEMKWNLFDMKWFQVGQHASGHRVAAKPIMKKLK